VHGQRLADRLQALPEPRGGPLIEVEAASDPAALAPEVSKIHGAEIAVMIALECSSRIIRIRNGADLVKHACHGGSLTIARARWRGDDIAQPGKASERWLVG